MSGEGDFEQWVGDSFYWHNLNFNDLIKDSSFASLVWHILIQTRSSTYGFRFLSCAGG